jgi:hypothetical protein
MSRAKVVIRSGAPEMFASESTRPAGQVTNRSGETAGCALQPTRHGRAVESSSREVTNRPGDCETWETRAVNRPAAPDMSGGQPVNSGSQPENGKRASDKVEAEVVNRPGEAAAS